MVSRMIGLLAAEQNLHPFAAEFLQDAVRAVEQIFDGLGFCLSEDGDLLSQWRGYANDGKGVAIGFSKEYLDWLCENQDSIPKPGLVLERVEYSLEVQKQKLTPAFKSLCNLVEDGVLARLGRRSLLDTRSDEEVANDDKRINAARMQLHLQLIAFYPHLYLMKSDAFKEEKEWRLLSYLESSSDIPTSYRVCEDIVIPYRSFKLIELERLPIYEVVLGPKNHTPPEVVTGFLKSSGFGNAVVRKSIATYR